MKILYAEDEEITRKNYARYISRYFGEVIEAKDGEEALEFYLKYRPDILLLDIDMPKLDGLDVAKEVRKSDLDTRIIMLTAIKDVEKLIVATELNLTKYLTKPIDRKSLKEALQKATDELSKNDTIKLADSLFWDRSSLELFYKNERIKLTKYERRFFELTASLKNHIFSNEEILEFVWENSESQNHSKLKDLVKRIRKKLPVNIIENVYSQGYRII